MMLIWCDDNTDDCSDYNDNDKDVDLFYPDVANFCVGRLGYQIGCFFTHCVKGGGGVEPMCKNLCCGFV